MSTGPNEHELADFLADLLRRNVATQWTRPVRVTTRDEGIAAIYERDDGGVGAVCISDLAFATYAAAAMSDTPSLVATRAFAVSPFAEHGGKYIYFGGFDANFFPASDTAWIFGAPVETVLASGP